MATDRIATAEDSAALAEYLVQFDHGSSFYAARRQQISCGLMLGGPRPDALPCLGRFLSSGRIPGRAVSLMSVPGAQLGRWRS